MSRWAPDRLSAPQASSEKSDNASAELAEKDPAFGNGVPPSPVSPDGAGTPFGSRPIRSWLKIAPFFLGAVFFVSAFLAVFSPLPIVLLGLMSSGIWLGLACITNAAIVLALGGHVSLSIYFVFVLAPAIVMYLLLLKAKKPEAVAGYSLLAMLASAGIVILFYAKIHHIHPWGEIKNAVSQFVDYWVKAISTNPNGQNASGIPVQDPAELEQWKHNLIIELPSAVVVVAIVTVWANLATVLRLNPRGIRARMGVRSDFFQMWKAPEWMIWPTIAAGATLLTDLGPATDVGRNLFKVMMAVYALQGISILSFFMLRWRFNRAFRTLTYLVSVLVMMPLLLGLGFFDLWFDFRSKFRQS